MLGNGAQRDSHLSKFSSINILSRELTQLAIYNLHQYETDSALRIETDTFHRDETMRPTLTLHIEIEGVMDPAKWQEVGYIALQGHCVSVLQVFHSQGSTRPILITNLHLIRRC